MVTLKLHRDGPDEIERRRYLFPSLGTGRAARLVAARVAPTIRLPHAAEAALEQVQLRLDQVRSLMDPAGRAPDNDRPRAA